MAGVILETLNVRKLILFGGVMLVFQVAFFLIGGLIAPAPNTSDQILMSKCIERSNTSRWQYTRPHSNESCEQLPDGDIEEVAQDINANQLVFVAQFPHPRDGIELRMTRWFQQLIGVLMLDVKQKYNTKMDNVDVTFDLRLGYRNRNDPRNVWHELARSVEVRPLKCSPHIESKYHSSQLRSYNEDLYYDCEVLPMFSLASCHHEEYLLNLRIPVDQQRKINHGIGVIEDVWMIEIHQNGGFTKVWFSLKTFSFPITLLALCFFVYRVRELRRLPTLLEKTIFVLGVGLSVLNCPIEWFSLIYNVPFWLIISDIRQGFFYAVLVCFWLVFTGEHMMQGSHVQSTSCIFGVNRVYWPRLILVGGCCVALFIFELAERGVQIQNPFYSIWSHPLTSKFGMTSIVIGGLCAFVYMIYLGMLVVQAFFQILAKRRLLVHLPPEQYRYYSGVIYRFTVLLAYTLLCAMLTVAFFIFSQVTEDQWKWGEHSIEYTSAFITGVYGMWNVYVVAVLCLYAPSHKFRTKSGQDLYTRLTTNTSIHVPNSDDAQPMELPYNADSENYTETIQLVTIPPTSKNNVSNSQSLDALKFIHKQAFE